MTTNIKILRDDKVIFDENCQEVTLNTNRDVKPIYGNVGQNNWGQPSDLAVSATNNVVLTGKFIKMPNCKNILL